MQIVRALLEDAEALAHLHRAAVFAEGAAFYPTEVLERWSPFVDGLRIARYKRMLEAAPDGIWTALDGDALLGFGAVDTDQKTLTLLYVAPEAAGRGVGTALLTFLEARARAAGCMQLSLVGSLNAEGFYARCGWTAVAREPKARGDGVAMEVVHMEKAL